VVFEQKEWLTASCIERLIQKEKM